MVLDKEKLLKWAKKEFDSAKTQNDRSAMTAFQNLKYELDVGTFDIKEDTDHEERG